MDPRRLHLRSFLIGAFAALTVTFSLASSPPRQLQVGRFSLAVGESSAILLDTSTGTTWRRSYDRGAGIYTLSSYLPGPLEKPR